MKINLLILINFVISSALFGQISDHIIVSYEGIIQPNEKNIVKNTQGKSESKMLIMNEMNKKKEYILIGNKFESIFEEIQKVDNNQQNNEVWFGNNKGLQLYINNRDSLFYEQINLHRLFLVKNKLNPIKWILDREYSDENKSIKKAHYFDSLNKMNIVAFYSTELNYKLGPDKFWGLPGLILELNIEYLDENSIIESFKFKAKEIERSSKISINFPKGKMISKKEYEEIINKIKEGHKLSEGIN